MTAPSIPFSARELAYKAYWFVVCMSRSTPWGVDMEQLHTARLATVTGAQVAVERAIAGPPRAFLCEPDDAALQTMRQYLETVRSELQTVADLPHLDEERQ